MSGAEGAWKGTSKPEHRVEGGVGGSGTAGGNEGRGVGGPPARACLSPACLGKAGPSRAWRQEQCQAGAGGAA